MLVNWQEQKQAENENYQPDMNFATAVVGAVYSDGLSLLFPGDTANSTKRYRYNLDGNFSVGDRVLLGRVSGTYIVICRI